VRKKQQGGENCIKIFFFFRRYNFNSLNVLTLSTHNFQFLRSWIQLVKGKAVPLQAWIDPEGSRKLRFPDFIKTAQNGSKVVSLTHRPPLPPGNTPGTHYVRG
jgi:hypothetical protein